MLIVLFWFISVEEHTGVAISRAKRSRNAYLTYDSGDCSNDNQTLTTQMEIPVSKFEESSYQADAGEDHISGSTEDTETDCSETDSVESDSDEEMAALSGEIFHIALASIAKLQYKLGWFHLCFGFVYYIIAIFGWVQHSLPHFGTAYSISLY